MRTTLTAVEVATSRRVDVLLDLEPTDPVSALEGAVRGLLATTARGLWLGAQPLDPAAPLGTSGVRPGCVLGVGGPLAQVTAPDLTVSTVRAELHVVSGPDAGLVHPLADGDTVVGHGLLTDPDAAPRHLQLHVGAAGVVAADLGNGPAVRRAGAPLEGPVAVGSNDLLEVGRNLLAVVPPVPPDAAVSSGPGLTSQVNRPPRLRAPQAVSTVDLPSPPREPERRRLALLPLLLPVALGVVMAVLSSPLFLLFTLLSPLLALSSWWSERRTGTRTSAENRAAHAARRADADEAVRHLVALEAAARRHACPDPAAVLLAATGPGARLWERRRGDHDSLLLRLGTGPSAAETVHVTGTPLESRPAQPTVLDVPIVLPLREVGVLGLAGPVTSTRALARWLVAQAAVLHSPRDLMIWLLVDPAAPSAEDDWGWLRWLPHTAPADGQGCAALVGTTLTSLTARRAELSSLVAARTAAAQDVRGHQGQAATRTTGAQPDLLVVLDGARSLRSLPGLATVLRDGPAVGVHVLCLDDQERRLPEECRAVVVVDGAGRVGVRRTGDEPRTARADLVSADWADRVSRALAALRDAGHDGAADEVPTRARLLEVLQLDPPTPVAVQARWGRSTAAVVGLDADGAYSLDLGRDGPHALVTGTTGAGKSEFLQTLVASLAVSNRPDAMTFVLVDYKGGAAFKDCARLPHTVGTVTDLDGHLVERALASLFAELRSREQLLVAVGAKDIEDYWRAGRSLPRLVIVIDEFASLAQELPDFVRGLVGIAQRGRSLGLHLVLATQRPSGVVSPEIRANTALRVALRVTDAAESLDVLDAPDAARISRSTPGRAYARTGHATLAPFQTARVGGRRPGAGVPAGVTATLLPWSRVGDPLPAVPVPAEPEDDATDLHALVEAIRAAAAELPAPSSPWLPPLPEVLTLDQARALAPATPAGQPAPVVFGLEDRPGEQARRLATLDLRNGGHLVVAGAPRTGRSTLLRTLATSLAATVSVADAHLYALDCGNGSLRPLCELPHCGAVVSRTEIDRADRLLTRLSVEVRRRQELLAGAGFAGIAEQRDAGAEPLPYLVLLVDGWEGFTAAFDDVDAGRMTDTFLRLLHEGPAVGLRVVVTGDRSLLLSKVTSSVEDTLVLRLTDRSDYALAGLTARHVPEAVPDGRGFRGPGGTEVQVALLADDPTGAAQVGALAALAATCREHDAPRPFRIDALPALVSAEQAASLPLHPCQAVLGVGGDELARHGFDVADHGPGFTIAGPPRSGRSTALLVAAQGLLESGLPLCVLAPRPSPLRELTGAPGVLHLATCAEPDPSRLAAALNAVSGPVALVVDDAELLVETAVAELLQQVLRAGRDLGHAVLLAGTTGELGAVFRGFPAEARKSRSGLLLSPGSHLDGELLGVRLPRSAAFRGPAGRGLLVRNGGPLLVQVPQPGRAPSYQPGQDTKAPPARDQGGAVARRRRVRVIGDEAARVMRTGW